MAEKLYEQFLSTHGMSFHDHGMNAWGLSKADALAALVVLEKDQCGLLGGDVFVYKGGRVLPDYSNWDSGHKPGESHDEFVSRSLKTAKCYIENYPGGVDNKLFVLVTE